MEPRLHLLVSAFVTDSGLNAHNTGNFERVFPSRIELFLSSIISLGVVDWASAHVFVALDEGYEKYWQVTRDLILNSLPNCHLHEERLSTFDDWVSAVSELEGVCNTNSLLLLNTNDDHALMPGAESELMNLVQRVSRHPDPNCMGQVTHFPEAWGALQVPESRERAKKFKLLEDSTDYADGTVLLKFEHFKSWFDYDFTLGNRFVRPDNPFGPWAPVGRSSLLVPRREIMRHLDGYMHLGVRNPCSPLPPSVRIVSAGQELETVVNLWSVGLGAGPVSAWSRTAAPDLRRVDLDTEYQRWHSTVVNVQAAFSFRPGFRGIQQLYEVSGLPGKFVFATSVIRALLLWSSIRVLPRLMLDWTAGAMLTAIVETTGRLSTTRSAVFRLGWRRGIRILWSGRRKSPLGKRSDGNA